MGLLGRIKDGVASARQEISEVTDAVRLEWKTPVPPLGAPLEECLAYLELLHPYVGFNRSDVVLLDGSFDATDAVALGEAGDYGDGIVQPLVTLCRTNLETNPEPSARSSTDSSHHAGYEPYETENRADRQYGQAGTTPEIPSFFWKTYKTICREIECRPGPSCHPGDMSGDQIEIHYGEEWAALYVNGKLDRVGDSYLAEERAFELLGVTTAQDDAFMRGQNQRDGVASTLDEVTAYRQQREEAQERAAELRRQAQELLSQAAELEK